MKAIREMTGASNDPRIDSHANCSRSPRVRCSTKKKLAISLLRLVVVAALFTVAWQAVQSTLSRFLNPMADARAGADVPARRASRGECIPFSINARQQPLDLKPVPGLADAVTDEELKKALCAALPWWNPPTVPSLMHELKLWGRDAVFAKGMVPQKRSGAEMVAILLSDKLCRERTTADGTTYLLESPFGIRVALGSAEETTGTRAETHFGQLLMTLAQAGVPLNTQVITASGRAGTVADLLHDAIMRFSWNGELEFIGTAIALWLSPERTWNDQFENQYSFDELIQRLVDLPLGRGACGGSHVPYAIVTILRCDEECQLLSAAARDKGFDYLKQLSRRLERTQLVGGGWDSSWSGGEIASGLYGDRLLDEINITGHHLEWIAIAPASLRPKTSVVTAAVRALGDRSDDLPALNRRVFKFLLPCSHAARALCLMRGLEPYRAWKDFWDRGLLRNSPPWGDNRMVR